MAIHALAFCRFLSWEKLSHHIIDAMILVNLAAIVFFLTDVLFLFGFGEYFK